jgi:Fur family ferric uptake transcriptional regulator
MSDRLINTLKDNNLRVTEARKEVFRVLNESEKALSVQEVYSVIKRSSTVKTDKVSVYRNLGLFSDLGLVHRFQDGRHAICMHQHGDDDHNHLHIVANCMECGSTFEVGAHDKAVCNTVNKIKSLVNDFGAFTDLTFQGTCKQCLKS